MPHASCKHVRRIPVVDSVGIGCAALTLASALSYACSSSENTGSPADGSATGGSAGASGAPGSGASGASSGGTSGAGGTGGRISTGGASGSSGGSTGGSTGSGGNPDGGGSGGSSGAPGSGGSPPGGATTDGGGTLCSGLGWCEILNTKLRTVCPDAQQYPDIQANEGCSGVINDWNGGMQDETRNRLIVWGGGHGGYFGNEVYGLDLTTLRMVRLNDPSDVAGYNFSDCYAPDAYPDGRPVSRHTYDALAYVAHADKMYSFSGAKAPCGYSGSDTWVLDLATISTAPSGQAAPWTLVTPTGTGPKGTVGAVSDYDPNTHLVFMNDGYNLWSFDYDTKSYALLNDSNATNAHIDYHMTGRVDPKRKLFIVIGGGTGAGAGMQVFDIAPGSNYAQQDWTSQVTGCGGLISEVYPGFAYDPVQDKMVGWAGGDDVYVFDAATKTCTTVTYGGGPGAQNMNGTMGRFRYFPSLEVFAVVNDWDQNAFTLRLTQ
jgi:hypothetical protein